MKEDPPTPACGGGTFPPQSGGTDLRCSTPAYGNVTGGDAGTFPPQSGGTDLRCSAPAWSQRGSITIWGIGLTLVIAAFAGLVIDTWRVFAERQDLSGMADSAAIAGATAVDIGHLNDTGDVILDLAGAELRALEYLERQDGWSADINFSIVTAADGSTLTVALEKDVDFTLLGPLLPGEDPLRITVTSRASPNVVAP